MGLDSFMDISIRVGAETSISSGSSESNFSPENNADFIRRTFDGGADNLRETIFN